jgi:predicted RNA-binding Zn-ribbon protein involved in translation (DUF1610 family)
MARYVCDSCGHEGKVPEGETADMVLCPVCGEPVTEL